MDRGGNTAEFTSGLPSPFPSTNGDSRSGASPQDQPSTIFSQPEIRSAFVTTATPTSEYYPVSARSGSFPDHRFPNALQPVGGSAASMASHNPSITSQSPTQYAYAHQQSNLHNYGGDHAAHFGHPQVYPPQQPRPDWGNYSSHTPITPNHHSVFHQQTTPTGQRQGNQVFSFVPIPGSQQHKRPRRRYEEIERMYKCGWNGCEKAYGTLNHLNAHVTMQSHGQKRIPEEFKEIRKEWKAKKKAEEAARKQHEDQARSDGQTSPAETQAGHEAQQAYVASSHTRNLPPPSLTYNPSNYPTGPTFATAASDYAGNYTTTVPGYHPSSPYAQSHQQVYSTQANGGQTH